MYTDKAPFGFSERAKQRDWSVAHRKNGSDVKNLENCFLEEKRFGGLLQINDMIN